MMLSGFTNSKADYDELCRRIRAIDPKADIPPASKGIAALRAANDLYLKLSGPQYHAPTAADKKLNDLNALQNRNAERLAQLVQKGLARYDAFNFEVPEGTTREAHLNGIAHRIQEIHDEANLTDAHRIRRAERDIEALSVETRETRAGIKEALSRISELEQEITRKALRS